MVRGVLSALTCFWPDMQLRREKTKGKGSKKALTCFWPDYAVEAIKNQRNGKKEGFFSALT